MKSIGVMIKQVESLINTDDLTTWENDFISSVCAQVKANKSSTANLSNKQVEIVQRVYNKHFGDN